MAAIGLFFGGTGCLFCYNLGHVLSSNNNQIRNGVSAYQQLVFVLVCVQVLMRLYFFLSGKPADSQQMSISNRDYVFCTQNFTRLSFPKVIHGHTAIASCNVWNLDIVMGNHSVNTWRYFSVYPLVNIQIAMENHHFSW